MIFGGILGGIKNSLRDDTPMALTDTKIRNLKAQDKPYKVADEKGLFLLITANGSKCWRVKYRIAGKEKLLALGLYPQGHPMN